MAFFVHRPRRLYYDLFQLAESVPHHPALYSDPTSSLEAGDRAVEERHHESHQNTTVEAYGLSIGQQGREHCIRGSTSREVATEAVQAEREPQVLTVAHTRSLLALLCSHP